MGQMIRKQIYIAKKHQIILKRLAKSRGISEAEVIRQALEHEDAGGVSLVGTSEKNALDKIIAFAMNRRKLDTAAEPYQWNREEIYNERLDRYN